MVIRSEFKKGRELILEDLLKNSLDKDYEVDEKTLKMFSPVKMQIGGRNFCGVDGTYVFKNRGTALKYLTIALSKSCAGSLINSDGVYERVYGAKGVIKVLFKDVYLTVKERELLAKQFKSYLKETVNFVPATIDEFLRNHHGVKLK